MQPFGGVASFGDALQASQVKAGGSSSFFSGAKRSHDAWYVPSFSNLSASPPQSEMAGAGSEGGRAEALATTGVGAALACELAMGAADRVVVGFAPSVHAERTTKTHKSVERIEVRFTPDALVAKKVDRYFFLRRTWATCFFWARGDFFT